MPGDELSYDPMPTYPAVDGVVLSGWSATSGFLPAAGGALAVDGPMIADWDRVARELTAVAAGLGLTALVHDVRTSYLPWDEVLKATTTEALTDDPDFEQLADGSLADLIGPIAAPSPGLGEILIVVGPGASVHPHDVLWYADLPKRYAETSIVKGAGRNLGQIEGRPTTKRLFYVDWPLLDRHRDSIGAQVSLWIDLQNLDEPAVVGGATLRATFAGLAKRPFRTRPFFNSTSWGGHWAQRELGMNPDAENTAIGYELIAPEAGVLIGTGKTFVEVPFQLLVTLHPGEVLGERVQQIFGTSFPVRFDYLDTVAGGNLSLHLHPRFEYMRDIFGWPYTQHETYYVRLASPGSRVYLGLHQDVDLDRFRADATTADQAQVPYDVTQYVQSHEAEEHVLYAIPAGTPHASGADNVVLEISATPYLYSLRFYDWLRTDSAGRARPVHVRHAFDNLAPQPTGRQVADRLIHQVTTARTGASWTEETLLDVPEIFYGIQRLTLDGDESVELITDDGFHVMNVVSGNGVVLTSEDGVQTVHDAETVVIPAATGRYLVRRIGAGQVRVVWSVIPRRTAD